MCSETAGILFILLGVRCGKKSFEVKHKEKTQPITLMDEEGTNQDNEPRWASLPYISSIFKAQHKAMLHNRFKL